MEYTQQEIADKMSQFVECARRVKGLKDYLLSFNFCTNDEEFLTEQIKRHDETVEEIGRIYDEEMLPLVNEMAAYLNNHRADFENLLAAERAIEAGEEIPEDEVYEEAYEEEVYEEAYEEDALALELDQGEADLA